MYLGANRTCQRIAAVALATAWVLAPSVAQDGPTIGVSAPLSGPSAILGEQIRNGAAIAAENLGAKLDVQNDACSAEGGATAARHFAEAKVAVVIGYLCTEALEAALPIFKEAGIPAITVGVRTDSLTDRHAKTGWPIFRLAPRGDGEATAIAAILPKLWRDLPVAIVDDGTIRNRDVAEILRAALEEAGVKPVLVDAFRPGLENQRAFITRLEKAGAKRVFVAGDSADIGVMIRDASVQNYDAIFAGGETLGEQPTPGLANGTLMIGLPQWRKLATADSLSRLVAGGVMPDGYVLPSYAAAQIAVRTAGDNAALESSQFETAIGPVRFDAKGDLAVSPYRLFEYDGRAFVPVETE